LSGDKSINYPKVEILINSKEIIGWVTYRNFIPEIMHFINATKEDIIYEPKDKSGYISYNMTTKNCAIKSLKSKALFVHSSPGFQYCLSDAYCHVFSIFSENKLYVKRNDKDCLVMKKFLKYDFRHKFESFDDKIAKITHGVKNNELFIEHLYHKFLFNKIHFIDQESTVDRSKLYNLKLKDHKFSSEYVKKRLTSDNGISSLSDCYEGCTNPMNDFSCDAFAFCTRNDLAFECNLGKFDDKIDNDKILEEDKQCNLYTISALEHFEEHPKKQFIDEDKKMINVFEETNNNGECYNSIDK
jgi:hypothetical protein